MRFAVVTFGTEGDTRPLAVLCAALQSAGHAVTLLAAEGTLGSARRLRVPHAPLTGDIRHLLAPPGGGSPLFAGGLNAAAQAMAGLANLHSEAWMAQTLAAARGCDAILSAGLAAFVGFSVAEALDIPSIGVGMIPLTPTAEFPSAFLPPGLTPRLLNRFSHGAVRDTLWRAFRTRINDARTRVCGLPPRRALWPEPVMLYGVSPTLLPRPADWPSTAHLCGQWIAPTQDWTPPPDLAEFLDQGEPPVYVGFGSMVGFDRRAMRDAVVEALAGRRALFFPGWSGAEGLDLPKSVFVVGETPHDGLFQRVSAVVHHGGSGTSHSALRAGRPSVVLPFAGDQPFWAERLRRLGVAPKAPSGAAVRGRALKSALDEALDADMRVRAEALGGRMRQEDGAAAAVAVIGELSKSAFRPGPNPD